MADAGAAKAILDTLGGVLTRWTMGSAAASAAPPVWRDALGEEPGEAELRLLALSSQFLGAAVVAEPQGGQALNVLPDLPRLALPVVSNALRPLVRRAMRQVDDDEGRGEVLHFLAERGWTIHPADWIPSADECHAPDVYAPWRDWAQGAASGETKDKRVTDELTAETWDVFYRSEREVAFRTLRQRDPDAARTLLEAKLAGEGADVRLRLVEVLRHRLFEADVPFLEILAAKDRAPKVKALAASLLARLGRAAAGEDMAELVGFFEVHTKGLLRRECELRARPLKTNAQKTRRDNLLAEADFSAFAQALSLAPLDLIKAWNWGIESGLDLALAGMAERSAPDEIVAVLADHIVSHSLSVLSLAPRLATAKRAQLAMLMLQGGGTFQNALKMGGPAGRIDDPIRLPAGIKLMTTLLAAKQAETSGEKPPSEHSDSWMELRALGLIASRAGVQHVLDRLTETGLLHFGPGHLEMIRLNAALEDEDKE